jgi:hypothetical protein
MPKVKIPEKLIYEKRIQDINNRELKLRRSTDHIQTLLNDPDEQKKTICEEYKKITQAEKEFKYNRLS